MDKKLTYALIIGILTISFSVAYYFFAFLPQKEKVKVEQQADLQKSQSENKTTIITRKDEFELEGFINDYFYRRQIKDSNSSFSDFSAYGSVVGKSIIVYVYPKKVFSQIETDYIKTMIKEGLQLTLLDFPDLAWTKDYSFDIIVRD
ncbi:hypothetical protein KKD57_03215 [Patescibacteria group bacterium]|nr:hypothetical protein [Patescibacteria group bacterium]